MTDKVQKIKEWISKTQDLLMADNGNFERPEHEGAFHILTSLDYYIEALQREEPAPKVFEDMLNAKTAAESLGISPEEHDKIVDECLYGKEPELVDEDDLPNKKEEPVSEDLEEACEQLAENARKHKAETSSPFFSPTDYKQGVMDGAKWQKEQIMKGAFDSEIKEIITKMEEYHATINDSFNHIQLMWKAIGKAFGLKSKRTASLKE